MKNFRNKFIFAGLLLVLFASAEVSAAKPVWRKGAIHTHTLWSDGRSLPEVAVKTYKDLGFDFMCITEHNVFPDRELWLPVAKEEGKYPPNLSLAEYRYAKKMLPGKIIERKIGVRDFVRLRTFKELQELFEEKGKFILMPGMEFTLSVRNARNEHFSTHFNTFNLAAEMLPDKGRTPEENFKLNFAKYTEKTKNAPEKSFFMMNHPQYRFWDIDPVIMVKNPEITHFEICNCVVPKKALELCSMEKYWDFILAHRLVKGQQPIYATASDDAHYYRNSIGIPAGVNCSWVMVNSPELTPDKITAAMKRGDFYATCGVELEEIIMDGKNKTLSVRVKPEKNIKYTISFIVTKKNFDRTIKTKKYVHDKNKMFNREFTVIPENIGTVVKTVSGTEGSYKLQADDLYVRAVIRSDKPITFAQPGSYPNCATAWTQPFCSK